VKNTPPACEVGLIRNANGICVSGPNACPASAVRNAAGVCAVPRDPNAPVMTLACGVGRHQEGRICVEDAKAKVAPAAVQTGPYSTNTQVRKPDGTCVACPAGQQLDSGSGQCFTVRTSCPVGQTLETVAAST
jgi:hypothetical protein